jgi:hypothetical protein
VHTLFAFDFAQSARLPSFYGDVQRIVFALSVPLWRFTARGAAVMLGGCHREETGTMHVFVHNIALNRSYHSAVQCEDCCPSAPAKFHAFLDMVQGSLHVVVSPANGGAHTMHTVPLDDWDAEGEAPDRADSAAVPIFAHDLYPGGAEAVQSGLVQAAHSVALVGPSASHQIIALEAYPTRVFPARARGAPHALVFALWHDPEQRVRAQLLVHRVTGQPGGASARVLVDMADIRSEVQQQLLREHYRASTMSAAGFQLLVSDFALLNTWDYYATELEQALPPTLYLVLACATTGAADTRLFVHVQIDVDGEDVRLAVSVLGAHALAGQTGEPRFALVLAPLRVHSEHQNVVVAVGRLVEVHRAGVLHSVKVMQVRCAACGDGDGRSYVPEQDRCECGAGAVAVCVPCVDPYACSVERFTFDRGTMLSSVNCSVQPLRGAASSTYYEVCMRCQQHGEVYCPDGRSFESCPGPERGVAGLAGVSGAGGCVCTHGAKAITPAPRQIGATGAYEFSECRALQCDEACAPCSNAELCNAALEPRLRVIACPPHSTSRHSSAAVTRFETNVTQVCECDPGFESTGTVLRFESAPSALDPNVHAAEWAAADEALFRSTRFRLAVSDCKLCPAGHFCAQGRATRCHTNSVSAEGQAACLCVPGFYQWSVEAGCLLCPPGHVCVDGTATPCDGVPDSGRRAGHPEAYCPCTLQPAMYYDPMRSACMPCPAGFYCPPRNLRLQPVDALDINVPTRCPAGSVSASRSRRVSECQCADPRHYMRTNSSSPESAACTQCAAGTYCTQNAQIPCPPGTDSPEGSMGRHSCLCVTNGSVFVGDACVCRAGFRVAGEECLACPYPTSARELGALACEDCRAGFWKPSVLASRFVAEHLPAYTDHPLSIQHRAVASEYLAGQQAALSLSESAPAFVCRLCPPGFVCRDGGVSLPAAPSDDTGFYLALPAGATTEARWLERCPKRLNADASDTRGRPLIMLGSCFPSTATWQWSSPPPPHTEFLCAAVC